ncbi:MAG: hypothetical protein K2O01_03680 [Bacteroidales bacterium]|nr:hypothetical protein [Bacteroidales bacterium]
MKRRSFFQHYGIYIFYLAALLPLVFLRDFTPSNELRYMAIADEALRDGHWFAFYYQGEPYADKPPLYLWIVMLGRWLFGDGCMAFVRLFSLLPGLGIVAVMDRWVREMGLASGGDLLGEARRRAGQWMLLTTAFFAGGMVVLRMDMLMSLFIVLALRVFYRMYTGREKPGDRWWFPLWIFMALFTKGPYGVMIPVVSAAVFLKVRRRYDLFGRCFGWRFWLVLLGLSGLWWGLVYAEGGYAYLHNLLFNQTVHRAIDSFSHKRGILYYFWSFGHAAAPWSPLYVAVLLTALAAWIRRRRTGRTQRTSRVDSLTARVAATAEPAGATEVVSGAGSDLASFFLTVFLTSLLMLSCISAKLEVYLLPVYPFVVYYVLLQMPRWENRTWARILVSVPLLVLTAALPAVMLLPGRIPSLALLQGFPIYIAAAVLTAGGLWGWWLLWRRRDTVATVRIVGCSLFVAVFVGAFHLPALNPYMGYGAVARAGQALVAEQVSTDMAAVSCGDPTGVTESDAAVTEVEDMAVSCGDPTTVDDPAVVYGAYRVRRAIGMAAYVHQPVHEMANWDEVRTVVEAGRPLLMFISGKALAGEPAVAAACGGRPQRAVGPYTAVWFGGPVSASAETASAGAVRTEGGRP